MVGCFQDTKSRILKGAFKKIVQNDVNACVSFCLKKGFNIAGLENGQQCHCAKELPKLKPIDDSKCSKKCPGDPKMTCGGKMALNIYKASYSKSKLGSIQKKTTSEFQVF